MGMPFGYGEAFDGTMGLGGAMEDSMGLGGAMMGFGGVGGMEGMGYPGLPGQPGQGGGAPAFDKILIQQTSFLFTSYFIQSDTVTQHRKLLCKNKSPSKY